MIRGRYYDSIHNCTLMAWNEAINTGKLHSIHLSGWYSGRKAKAAWIKIYDEYLKEFGLPQYYKTYLKTMVWAMEELAISYTTDKSLRPIAQIREAQAKALISGPKSKLTDSLAVVSKSMGFRVDPKTTTVAEFYGYVNQVNGK